MVAGSVDALTRDLRSAVRRLSRARTLSTIVVLSLALGIGANTAIFSVARSILVVHVPYQNPDRVVLVETYVRDVHAQITEGPAVIQRLARSLERVEAFSSERINWRRGESTLRLSRIECSASWHHLIVHK